MHGSELRLFLGQGISTTLTIYVAHLTAKVGTIFSVYGYGAMSDQDLNLLPSRRRVDVLRVEPWSRVILLHVL